MRQLITIIWSSMLVRLLVSFAIVFGAVYLISDRCLDKGLDDRLRIAGGILQLLGVWVVAKGLSGKRKLVGLGSLWDHEVKFFRLLRQYLTLGAIGGTGKGVLPELQVNGSGSASLTADLQTNDRDRIDALIRDEKIIAGRIDSLEIKVGMKTMQLTTAINAEHSERNSQYRELQHAVVGDINLDLAGVIWLLVGIFLATYSPELAKLWGGLIL